MNKKKKFFFVLFFFFGKNFFWGRGGPKRIFFQGGILDFSVVFKNSFSQSKKKALFWIKLGKKKKTIC